MRRSASLLPALTIVCAAPAAAGTEPRPIDIPAMRSGEAVRVLSRQAGVSIGFRDPTLAAVRTRSVRGRLDAQQALTRMLADSGLRAREVRPGSFLVEMAPRRMLLRRVPTAPVTAAAPDPVEDIVVTASKRGVTLASYPGGVQIVDGAEISSADAARGTDLIETRAASVTSTHLGPGRNKLFIRGIADSSIVGPTQATVGQYWGNSRITYAAPDPSLRLHDIRSVEVLEGPQATLYGAGSLGGVVRVVPNAPDLAAPAASGWAGVQAVQDGRPGIDGGAILNVPLTGEVGLRALGFGSIEGGYIDDRARGLRDINRVGTIGGRAVLRYAPADWTVDTSLVGQSIRGDDSQYADRAGNGLDRASSIAQPYSNDYWLADLVATRSVGRAEWTNSIGYARHHIFERFEGPTLPDIENPATAPATTAAPSPYTQDNRIRMLTAETRIAERGRDGRGWMAGASFLHNVGDVRRGMADAPLTGVRNAVSEITVYGEYGLGLTRSLTLTAGGRLTRSRLAGEARDVVRAAALRIDPEADRSRIELRLLPSLALAWAVDDRTMIFGRYQQGFRPGGISVRRDFIQRFDGDRLQTVETGVRHRTDRIEGSLTLSRTEWRSIQADLVDGFGFPTTANIGDGRILSLGLSTLWRPVPDVELDASLYLNDGRVLTASVLALRVVGEAFDLSRLPNVADRSGRIGAAWTTMLDDGLRLAVRAHGRYIGQSTLGIGSILGRLQGDYLDTGLEVRVGRDRWSVGLAATNLANARGNRFALGSPFLIRDQNQITPLRPRAIRLGVQAGF